MTTEEMTITTFFAAYVIIMQIRASVKRNELGRRITSCREYFDGVSKDRASDIRELKSFTKSEIKDLQYEIVRTNFIATTPAKYKIGQTVKGLKIMKIDTKEKGYNRKHLKSVEWITQGYHWQYTFYNKKLNNTGVILEEELEELNG